MKSCSNSCRIKGMYIWALKYFCHYQIGKDFKIWVLYSVGQDVGKQARSPLMGAGAGAALLAGSLAVMMCMPSGPALLLQRNSPAWLCMQSCVYVNTVHCNFIIIARDWKQTKCPSRKDGLNMFWDTPMHWNTHSDM